MSSLPAHRHRLFPAVNDWLTGFPPVENLRPLFEGRLIKVEEELADNKYLLRAELPGIRSGERYRRHCAGGRADHHGRA